MSSKRLKSRTVGRPGDIAVQAQRGRGQEKSTETSGADAECAGSRTAPTRRELIGGGGMVTYAPANGSPTGGGNRCDRHPPPGKICKGLILYYMTILYYTILYYIILCYIILYYIVLYYIILCYIISSCLIVSYLVLHYINLSYLVLSSIILPYIILYYMILYSVVLQEII